jgi:hypothetical protein
LKQSPTRSLILVTFFSLAVLLGFVDASWAQTKPVAWSPLDGAQVSQRPPFRYYGVPGATGYNLRIVDGADNVVVYAWFSPAETSCAGDRNCAVTSPVPLSPGTYIWAVRSWSEAAGYSIFTPLTSIVVTSSQEKYLTRVQSNQAEFPAFNSGQQQIVGWIQRYLDPGAPPITRFNLPHLLGVAMRRMYMTATVRVTDIVSPDQHYVFFDMVMANPERAIWANCSDSVVFMMRALNSFGIAAQQVSLWSSINDGHDAIEYYSEAFKKTIYYDPLYGALLLDDAGVPASLENIVEEVNRFGNNGNGFAYAQWDFWPVRFSGWSQVDAPDVAADARFEYYRALDYSWGILRSYPTVIARRHEDTTSMGRTLPGENVVMGKWVVFDSSASSPYPDYFTTTFWPAFYGAFDEKRDGRYRLLVVKTVAQ